MKKVFKFVKGKKDAQKENVGVTPSQSRDLSSPAQTPEDERFISLDTSSGYIVDFCGKDKTLTKLHKAAWQGHLEKLKSALKKVEIDAVDRHNRSALHFAVAQGHPNIVWYLLGNNAKMTICDDEGCTPLLKAVECGHKDCMTLLLERGADINNPDYQGNTGLHIAAKQGTLDVASALISRGATLDVANNCGEYPLHIATRLQNKDLVELLLRSRASVNVFDRENRTPLMLAAKTGNLLLVQLFFEYGAQLTVVDSNGWTAEDYALLGGHQIVAEEIKSYMKSSKVESAKLETHNEEDESEAVKSNEDSSTWNDDGQTSSESKDRVTKKIKNFFEDRKNSEKDKEEDLFDSPESEAMPPPCQPPRSWDMIQAGMIDAKQEGSESKRLSITVLGTLHSRRKSFTEATNSQTETTNHTLSLNRRRPVKRENSFAKQRLSFNEEESLKSWISDASSTLQEIDKIVLDKFRKVENPEERKVSESDWDSDCPSVPAVFQGAPDVPEEEALKEVDEIWVSNDHITKVTGEGDASGSGWDSDEHNSQEDANFPPPPSGIELGVNMARSIGYMKGISIDHPVGDVLERNVLKNSHRSADCLEEKEKNDLLDSALPGSRRHTRHQSISTFKWKSEEIPQKSMDIRRRIDEELRCYDQALKELAEAHYTRKIESEKQKYYSLPASRHKPEDKYYYDRSKPVTDSTGPLSLPFSVNVHKEPPKEEVKQEETRRKSKRHMLLAMRDVKHAAHVANAFKTSIDDQILSPLTRPPDESDSENEQSPKEREQHFFKPDFRQETVIERPEFRRKSSSSGEEPTLWLQEETGAKSPLRKAGFSSLGSSPSPKKDAAPMGNGRDTSPSSSSEKASGGGENKIRIQDPQSPDVSFSSGPIEAIGAGKDSGSEADSTHNEVSPSHNYTLQTHHEWLKNHLKTTTTEKNKLEQVAVELSEKAERLQYELADAKEATKSKDEVILLLQNQLARMESAYTKSLEESVQSRLQLTTHEQEILHLKELCFRYEEEKERLGAEPDEDECIELRSRIRLLEEEKDKMKRDILRLEQEKSSLEKRLQEVTTSEIIDQCQRWKERFENLEESTKVNDEAKNAYLVCVKSLREEYQEREKKLGEHISHLEKTLAETQERNVELEAKVQSLAETGNEKMKKKPLEFLAEVNKKGVEIEAPIKNKEKEMNSHMSREEHEIQAVIKRFMAEREALINDYESKLAEKRSGESETDWRNENEKLKSMVRHLQGEFANLQAKSSLEEANENLKKGVEALKEQYASVMEVQNRGKEELDSLMKENLNLKMNELKIKLLEEGKEETCCKEDLMKVITDHASVKTEMVGLKSEIEDLRRLLGNERKLLEQYREKNAGLEQEIAKLSARQSQKTESSESRQNRKRGVGKEDELAWTNLYGIKRAGKGREGSIMLDDFVKNESRTEVRQKLEENFRAEEEKARQTEQLLDLKEQLIELQTRMAEEKATRRSLEGRLTEMEEEMREKERLELEVRSLRRKIDLDLVPRTEIELLQHERELQTKLQKEREEREDPAEPCDYREKCERFAKEMEKSKEIRKRIKSSSTNGLGTVLGHQPKQEEHHRQLAVSPIPLQTLSMSDLEPELKSKLNLELERSIKRHLTDVAVAGEKDIDLFNKFLQ